MGYESLDFKPGEKTGNLPAIYLTASVNTLEEIIVNGERKTQTIQIDKQIFDTKQFQNGKAGIVNIITKKDQIIGWSFVANGMTGGREPLRYGSDFSANYTGSKASFFVGADYRRFDIEGFRIGEIRTLLKDSLTFLPSEGIRNYKDYQFGIRSGLTYTPTKREVLNVNWYMGEKQTDRTANLHYE